MLEPRSTCCESMLTCFRTSRSRRIKPWQRKLRPLDVPRVRKELDHRSLMLLTLTSSPFTAEGWVFEVKYDGYRALAIRRCEGVVLLSRNGRDMAYQFPEVARALTSLPEGAVVDGEITVSDSAGRPNWSAVRGRAAMRRPESIVAAASSAPAIYYAFDLLALGDRDLRRLSLLERKELLALVIPRNQDRVRYVEHYEDGLRLFEAVQQCGLEGMVAKRADSPYRAGRTFQWLKTKSPTAREQRR